MPGLYKLTQTTFQQDTPVFVFRSFIANGRKFERGSDFPWREMGIPPEKVATLYRIGKLRHRATPVIDGAEPTDDLTDMGMKQLRIMAGMVGAPKKASKADQRAAIRAARAGSAA